jgi:hypothetical protein
MPARRFKTNLSIIQCHRLARFQLMIFIAWQHIHHMLVVLFRRYHLL